MLVKLNLRGAKAFLAIAATLLVAAQCASASLSISGNTAGFRDIPVGVSRTETLTIVNSGGAAAVLGTISEAALGLAAPFSLSGGTCVSGGTLLPNGGSCTLEVTFSPTAAGSFSERLTVTYNWADSGVSDQIVRLDFSGLARDSVVAQHCDPYNAFLPFGTRPIGSSTAITFTFRNFGAQPAIFDPLSTASIGLAAPFSLSGGSCLAGQVAPLGGSCTLEITFTPTSTVTSSDNVELSYRFAGDSVRQQAGSCRIEGTGAEPIAITGGPAFDYRALSLGSSALKTFVVTNWHDEAVTLNPMTSAGLGLAAPFRLAYSSCPDGSVAPKGGQCTLQVAFSPSQLGPALDRLEVHYRLASAGTEGTLAIDLSGRGVASDPVVRVAASSDHTCALLSSGAVRCWGLGYYGALGYGNTQNIGDDESPSTAGNVDVGGPAVQIVTGERHTCALLASGNVRCWGTEGNRPGLLGYGRSLGAVGDDELPSSVGDVNVGGRVVQLAAGSFHTCALLDTGAVRCWGPGGGGALGYGNAQTIGDDEHPAAAGDVNVGGSVTQITAGSSHTCALLSTNRVRCWGYGFGVLGYGNTNMIGDDELPFTAGDIDVGGAVTQVSAGIAHTCARLVGGAVRCWGYGPPLLFDNVPYGSALGYGHVNSIGDDEAPASAGDVNVGGSVAQVHAGGFRTCALLATGTVRCWGRATPPFSLGYGNSNHIGDDETPASAGDIALSAPATQVSVGGGWHTCARLSTGHLQCWGGNRDGQLGYAHTRTIGDDELPAAAGVVAVQ